MENEIFLIKILEKYSLILLFQSSSKHIFHFQEQQIIYKIQI